jgi:hypothetical protein
MVGRNISVVIVSSIRMKVDEDVVDSEDFVDDSN